MAEASPAETPNIAWEAVRPSAAPLDDALVVDVDGFEGPLDLLLHLARRQKVDLSRVSVLALANQYLDFIAGVGGLRLELAADYLVMAAWLAFLKSRLLLPQAPSAEGETGEAMAAALQLRLRRLEAMREAGARLMARDHLGREVFARGMTQEAAVETRTAYRASLHDLLSAYAAQRQRRAVTHLRIAQRPVWSLKEARQALARLLGRSGEWAALDGFLLAYAVAGEGRRSALASSFAASLELVREGAVEMRQDEAFAPLMLRARARLRPVEPAP